jgi:hypothetical protein
MPHNIAMTVLVFEDNLIWSSRLVKSLKALGHTPIVRIKPDSSSSDAQVAIVNLGSEGLDPEKLVPALNAAGIHTIGHAGHKETELLEFGRSAGCKTLATNSQLTFKLESLLAAVQSSDL